MEAKIELDLCQRMAASGERAEFLEGFFADEEAPGWVSDGFFMAYVGSVSGIDKSRTARMASLLERIRAASHVPLRARPEFTMPLEREPCGWCENRARERNGCGNCDGEGLVTSFWGQVVFTDEHGYPTIISPKYADLLEGLDVARAMEPGAMPPSSLLNGDERPVVGLRRGALLVILMPMRGVVRSIAAARRGEEKER